MTNEEVFDDDFYQEDFSTASEWEAFVSRLNDLLETYEVIDEENLKANELSLCDWSEESEEILFNDFDLVVTRYKAKIPARESESSKSVNQVFSDLISAENDFCLLDVNYLKNDYEVLNSPKPPSLHPIAVFYGLRDFVVIRSKRKSLTDVNQIKLLQSSLSLAINDSKVPVFIQVLYKEQEVFLGMYESGEFRLSFDVVHLRQPPPSCKYLSGLLDMFKGKNLIILFQMNFINLNFRKNLNPLCEHIYGVSLPNLQPQKLSLINLHKRQKERQRRLGCCRFYQCSFLTSIWSVC
jgi:Rab3 GTPase-activating protein catalytic subunit